MIYTFLDRGVSVKRIKAMLSTYPNGLCGCTLWLHLKTNGCQKERKDSGEEVEVKLDK